jgi:hypothetical protein
MKRKRVRTYIYNVFAKEKKYQLQRAVALIEAGLDIGVTKTVRELIETALVREGLFDEIASRDIAGLLVYKAERGVSPHVSVAAIIKAGDAISRRRALDEYGWDGEIIGTKFAHMVVGQEIAPAIDAVRLAAEASANLYREIKKVKSDVQSRLDHDYAMSLLPLTPRLAPRLKSDAAPNQILQIEARLAEMSLRSLALVRLTPEGDILGG